ncbi:T9SS type A sorting domain-containing protein [Rhodothermus bifroesti]|jgi:hypothetical protein|uniref:T9SS type A sorting domain-containing protein n=1 Tax=Rhodothermus marinus TaxID=29549 RepID=A0A7V2F6E8_RHOMR|nr:T9SS type A sorting domain-containing protein [Rhodothermus bifroesti]GBD01984.1 hypothetical protein HRbin18_01715 [bacterium HR18]
MHRRLFWLSFWLWAASATAQSFYVERSDPASGTAAVAREAVVRFVFNDAVSQQTDFNTAFLFIPQRAVRVRRVDLIPETPSRTNCPSVGTGQVCPNQVLYTITHEPEVDYTWLVFAVRNARGRAMTRPYVLRYTTATAMGTLHLSGMVEVVGAKRMGLSEAEARTLRLLLDQAIATGLGRPVFEREALVPQAESDFTVVFLLRHFSQTIAAWDVAAATVLVGHTGAYKVDYLRPGTYWPVAVRYRSLAQLEIEALGYYDADGDGMPDPITLQDAVSDVRLHVYPFRLATAREQLPLAREAAAAVASDAYLIGLMATNSPQRSGKAYSWIYTFFSPAQAKRLQVRVDPLGIVVSEYREEALAYLPPVPEPFIDSDRALDHLLARGMQVLADSIQKDPTFGLIFDPNTPTRNLVVHLVGGGYYTNRVPSSDSSYWQVRLTVFTATQTRTYEGLINMTTGKVRVLTNAEGTALVGEAPQLWVYPNPLGSHATFRVYLPQAGFVRLKVYDVLGREVACLYEEAWLLPGVYESVWHAPGLANGLYLAVLQYGPIRKTYRMIKR